MSLYGQYIIERTADNILEDPYGFATYRYINDGRSVYIVDLYVIPEGRQTGRAAHMADRIVEAAKARGCTELLGTVVPSTKNSTTSLKVLIGYGMTLLSAATDLIVFRKDI